ncbi:hypothetical protein [Paractinoplanes atraurantiacus]|uniref:DUF4397 domain-containing protein n=1 Tax=Paractinoplanes atraurantiacus TaxID=1036182 RepID=A0A285KCV7_9ACTN|nr:hypothetical protein [Actinoplanes atraurantiacus]SNY69767.1 hypothetical protein SAMN05421748_1365 [Actinoplanes atraurantiacus]
MRFTPKAKTVLAGVAAAALCSTAAVTVAAGPAAAAMGKGRVQICSQGDFDSWLEFVGSTSYNSTYVASPGQCVNETIPPGTYSLSIIGQARKAGALRGFLGATPANPNTNPGVKVFTRGSFPRPTHTVTS